MPLFFMQILEDYVERCKQIRETDKLSAIEIQYLIPSVPLHNDDSWGMITSGNPPAHPGPKPISTSWNKSAPE